MTLRTKVVLIYCIIAILAIGLCWRIYQSVGVVNQSFTAFVDKDMQALHYLFSIRDNLHKHERLVYEYYIAPDRRKAVLVQLTLVQQLVEEDFTHLRKIFKSSGPFQVLESIYTGFTVEHERLIALLEASVMDWDAARESIAKLRDHARRAGPVLDLLFQQVRDRSGQSQGRVVSRLKELTELIVGFVIIMLILILAMLYFTRETLQAESDRRRLAFFPERSPNPIYCLTLDGEIIYANPSSYRMAAMIDENLQVILPTDIKDRVRTLLTSSTQSQYHEYKLSGHLLSARLQLFPDLALCYVYISDVTEERAAQHELRFLAYHDPITGLPNRHSFLKDCEKWASGRDFDFSVAVIGFHRFELVIRNLGLDAVDELLKQIGRQLKYTLAAVGTAIHTAQVYRLSGASFAMLLRVQHGTGLREVTERVADSLLLDVSQPLIVRRREFWLRPAIGLSYCPDDAVTPAKLMGYASAALAYLSAENRQGYQAISTEIMGAEESWLETETALRHSMENGEFCLHYQPKVAATDGSVSGLEALIRWDREGYGLVSPAKFIPVAEESGLILMLGEWVLNEACRQAVTWRDAGKNRFTIAVNVSALQFQQEDFITHVEQALLRHGLDPRFLELEITETLIMQDLERNITILKSLRELGLELSVDDFGTGYSSFEYLRRFPVTRLKIDRAFITNIAANPRECAIVSTMIELAHHLDMEVVAEGVETKEQADVLVGLGCDELQGFYFCHPLAPDKVMAWWSDKKNV